MTIPLTYVDAPDREPRPNTSLDVLPISDVPASHFVGYTYVADPCAFPNPLPKDCYIQIGPATTAVSEVQRATITGVPTGGTFTLTYSGSTTTAIAYNATAATVQAALEALDNINPGDVVVGGGPGPATPYTFTFGGALASADLPQMTATGSFTGGTTPAIAITTTTAGVSPKTFGGVGNETVTQVFGAYQGIECQLNGGVDNFRELAQRVLENGEYRVVDGALTATLLASATATSPATATTITSAIGILELYLATQVPGQGYIFLTPLATTYAAANNLLVRNLDGSLETYLGTPVVVLSEPSMVNVAYASGPVHIWRGPIVVNDAPNLTVNKARAIAERLYSLVVECGAWKVAFTPGPTADPTGGGEPALALTIGTEPASPIPDGTDTTITVHANTSPDPDEVHLWYRINGAGWVDNGEMAEVNPLEFVENVDGDLTVAGDVVELYATAGSVMSPTITVNVT